MVPIHGLDSKCTMKHRGSKTHGPAHHLSGRSWNISACILLSGPLLLATLLLSSSPVWPVEPDYTDLEFRHFQPADGLSQTNVRAFLEDQRGYLWFGTEDGLNRYDGYTFRHFAHNPHDPHSLPDPEISALLEDEDGRIWIGTRHGIARLDPRTDSIRRYSLPESEPPLRIQQGALARDALGRIWAVTRESVLVHTPGDSAFSPWTPGLPPVAGSSPRGILTDQAGRLWLSLGRDLYLIDKKGEISHQADLSVTSPAGRRLVAHQRSDGSVCVAGQSAVKCRHPDGQSRVLAIDGPDDVRPTSLVETGDGALWLGRRDGVFVLESGRETFDPVEGLSIHTGLEQAPFSRVWLDRHGSLWIGTVEGITIKPAGDGKAVSYSPGEGSGQAPLPAASTNAYDFQHDSFGGVWILSALSGVSRVSLSPPRFQHISLAAETARTGRSSIVRAMQEQRGSNGQKLWVGIETAGYLELTLDAKGALEASRPLPIAHGLPWNQLRRLALYEDRAGRLWASCGPSLCLLDENQGRFRIFPLPTHPGAGPGDSSRIEAMTETGDGDLWLATTHGLARLTLDGNPEPRVLIASWMDKDPAIDRAARSALLSHQFSMYTDHRDRVWVATAEGVVIHDPAGRTWRLLNSSNSGLSLSRTHQVLETPEDTFWLATRGGGLNRMAFEHPEDIGSPTRWQVITTAMGLANDTVYGVRSDTRGRLWLSSNQGISRYDPVTRDVRNFHPKDGLQHLEFNHAQAHRGETGRLYFGGINGLNVFDPERVHDSDQPPRVHITGLQVMDGPIQPAQAGNPLDFSHGENFLTLHFVGIHHEFPEMNRYIFRMEGVDEDWVDAGSSRMARYPGLASGNYRFRVRAANSDGVWSADEAALELAIAPPWWQTRSAWLGYVLIVLCALALYKFNRDVREQALGRKVAEKTAQLKADKALIEHQARQLETALESRKTLFANISHEFRTPLTIILGHCRALRRRPETVGKGRIDQVEHYANRLLGLVDRLLGLAETVHRRDDSRNRADLDRTLVLLREAFDEAARAKGIELAIDRPGMCRARCHARDLEQILENLVSNAIKYTPAGGRVCVNARHCPQGLIEIRVTDSGRGIPPHARARVFDRFFREASDTGDQRQGTGIGLALVRELVLANHGRIDLDSEPGRGTEFRLHFPAARNTGLQSPPTRTDRGMAALPGPEAGPEPAAGRKQQASPEDAPRLLVIEDNPAIRGLLREQLGADYRITEVRTGERALEKTAVVAHDLILADLNLPGMSGFELIEKLREDFHTCHLPIIALTARNDQASRLRAMTLAVDTYLTKPWHPQELELHLTNLLETHRRIRQRLAWRLEQPDEEHGSGPGEDPWLARFRELLHENCDNPEFSVRMLAEKLNVSDRSLQVKIKGMTGKTPREMLMGYRLEKARSQLQQSGSSIGQIAEQCGFARQSHFSRRFRDRFGVSPSGFRKRQAAGDDSAEPAAPARSSTNLP